MIKTICNHCEESIRADERMKFAEWIESFFGLYDCYGSDLGVDFVISRYEKEQKNE